MSRYWFGVSMTRWTSPQFPWATVVINVSGSFAIGFLAAAFTALDAASQRSSALRHGIPRRLHHFKLGLAGATATRGVMGFGKQSVIHKSHFLGLSDDLPEKIEIIDQPAAIDRLLPVLGEMLGAGLVVIEDVHVARYLHDDKKSR